MKKLGLIVLLLARIASFSQSHSLAAEPTAPPDLNLILQSLERVEQQNPARSRPYELMREYKAFRAVDKQPTSEITAQISFSLLLQKDLQDHPGERERKGRKDSARSFGAGNRACERRSQ